MPGEDHEFFAHVIGYLLTTFLLEKGIPFKPTGAKTQEQEGQASAQADQSYCIGEAKPIPDLSIEVIFTSGGNKLARDQTLRVSEVGFGKMVGCHCTVFKVLAMNKLAAVNFPDSISLISLC